MSLMSSFAGNEAGMLDSVVIMNLTFNMKRLQGSVTIYLRAIPD